MQVTLEQLQQASTVSGGKIDTTTPEAAPKSGVGETFSAALQLDNVVGSTVHKARVFGLNKDVDRSPLDPNFDPFVDIAGYEEHADEFIYDRTDEEVEATKRFLNSEAKLRKVQANAGTFTNILTGIAVGALMM